MKYNKTRLAIDYVMREDGMVDIIWAELNVPMNSIRKYRHTLFRLLELTPCEHALMDWITEQMKADNSFYFNDEEVGRFIRTINKYVGKKINKQGIAIDRYTAGSVAMAFKELKRRRLVAKLRTSAGLFNVNPIFFVKNSRERDKLIKIFFEFDTTDSKKTKDLKLTIFKEIKEIIEWERK